MIKSNKGEIRIEGAADEILADICFITANTKHAFKQADIDNPEKLIRTSVEDGLSMEDIGGETTVDKAKTKNVLKKLIEALEEELGG